MRPPHQALFDHIPAPKTASALPDETGGTRPATVPFAGLTSEALKNMTAPTDVLLPVGDEKENITVTIPAPDKADLKAARYAHKTTQDKREKLLLKAIEKNKIWQTAYMIAVRREKDSDMTWFDPNCSFEESFFHYSGYLLDIGCEHSTKSAVALLLQNDGLNICREHPYDSFSLALYKATQNKDLEESRKIMEMLCLYKNIRINDTVIDNAKTKTMRDLLTQTRNRQKAMWKSVTAPVAEPETPVENTKNAESEVTEDGAVWKKLDAHSICKLTEDGDGFRLRRIFSFKSGTMSEIHEYLDEKGRVRNMSSQNIVAFNRLGSRKEVEEAQEVLRGMNAAQTQKAGQSW
ncbi:MAG: hypothetical protein EA357_06595 [Micavibrio sp.]|nr:MAG: hypothetical protein EA357_06595 [Micavibrio sp.]